MGISKKILRGKLITAITYVRNEKRSQINLNFYLKDIKKKKKVQSKYRKRNNKDKTVINKILKIIITENSKTET